MYYNVLYVSKSSGSRQDVYVYYTCGYFIFLTLVTVFLLYVYLPTTNNAVARYGFPNTTLQLERIDLTAAWIGKRRKRNKKTEKKNGNLNNIITPSGEVACWPRALLSAPSTPRRSRYMEIKTRIRVVIK